MSSLEISENLEDISLLKSYFSVLALNMVDGLKPYSTASVSISNRSAIVPRFYSKRIGIRLSRGKVFKLFN